MHPVVFFDVLRVKIHQGAVVRNKAAKLIWLSLRNITADWDRAGNPALHTEIRHSHG